MRNTTAKPKRANRFGNVITYFAMVITDSGIAISRFGKMITHFGKVLEMITINRNR
jgi:hypothetical protein